MSLTNVHLSWQSIQVSLAPKAKELGRNPKTSGLIYFCSSNFALKKKQNQTEDAGDNRSESYVLFLPLECLLHEIHALQVHYKSTSTVLCSSFCSNIQVTKVRKRNTRKCLRVVYITVPQLCLTPFAGLIPKGLYVCRRGLR